jgi:hypothetical protein
MFLVNLVKIATTVIKSHKNIGTCLSAYREENCKITHAQQQSKGSGMDLEISSNMY